MTNERLPATPDWVTYEPTHADIVGTPTLEELVNAIGCLWEIHRRVKWWLADLIIYAEDESPYGQMYAQAIEVSGRSYDTLKGYVRVARAVPPEMRRASLPWTYHKAVAIKALPPEAKDEYLGRAAAGEFADSDELKWAIKVEQGLADPPALLDVPCPACGSPLDERGAARGKCGVCGAGAEEWARRAERLALVLLAARLHIHAAQWCAPHTRKRT